MTGTKTMLRIALAALPVLLAAGAALAGHVDGAAAPAARQLVDNPYGLEALWAQGDFVSKGTLILLALMSMASWYILVVKLVEQARVMGHAKAAAAFWKSASVADGARLLAEASPFRYVAAAGIDAAKHHEGALTEKIDLHTWVTMSVNRAVGEVISDQQGGLAVLATVGSTAPFVGLFGTVWGIYHALTAIGIAGQAAIDKVAGPVGEALIMTAFGLAVAVPAVLGYNLLVRRNKLVAEKVRAFAADLHAVLLAGTGGGGGSLRVVR